MDFSISVVIFITTVILIFFAFNLLSSDALGQIEISRMQDTALEVTESLVRTTGQPKNWTPTTVGAIGLVQERTVTNTSTEVRENVLDEGKVLNFIDEELNYNHSKVLMGISNYEYYFQIKHLNGTILSLQGVNLTKGLNYTNAMDIVSVERYAILSNSLIRLQFLLWK